MVRLEWLFLIQLVMGVLMIIFLQKITQMKKQVDTITKAVMDYISYITEDIETEGFQEASPEKNEAAQSRLIQAVLGEYFP